ncbi:unnamed protein product [Larinioides sclopetarius]|uniref:Uncharacterized protein n=1 Tax=Larinioides sclopetarius TaxID=280406 RepID=A0AAV1ZTP5_9ARAC
MKHFQAIIVVVVALCLVADNDSGTHKTRRIKRRHVRQGDSGGNDGLIKGFVGGLRNLGNEFVGGAQNAVKDLGPVGGILNGIGDIVNYAINGTDSIIDEANDFVGDTARQINQEGKNIVGTGDQNPFTGFFDGIGNIISGAANGAKNIAGEIADGIDGAASTFVNDIF